MSALFKTKLCRLIIRFAFYFRCHHCQSHSLQWNDAIKAMAYKAMHNIYSPTIFQSHEIEKDKRANKLFVRFQRSFRPKDTRAGKKNYTENTNNNMKSTHMWNALRWNKVETEWKWRLKIWYAKNHAAQRWGTVKKRARKCKWRGVFRCNYGIE